MNEDSAGGLYYNDNRRENESIPDSKTSFLQKG